MDAEFFIDTNVFTYHLDSSDPSQHATAEGIVRVALTLGNGCISTQVVQGMFERRLAQGRGGADLKSARRYLEVVLAPLGYGRANEPLYHRALDVQARWRFGFYDSLIAASALAAGCRTLLSEDLQHGQRLDELVVVNLFL